MKKFTIDASVIVKWIFPESNEETHTSQALVILKALQKDLIKVIQPSHWFAETIAVIVRLQPEIVSSTIDLLSTMELSCAESAEVYQIAANLADRHKHHLFDTLYHAVALNNNAMLITADDKYYRKAKQEGAIIRLADFDILDM